MTTQLLDTPTGLQERETVRHTAAGELRADAFAILDHKLRAIALATADALPGHYLALSDGDGAEHLIPLPDAVIHVGRAGAADLRFEDVHVSRRHAIVIRYGDHVRVLDDRSSAGTFVNGRRIIAADLLDGDIVRLGPVLFSYRRVR